MEEFQSIIGVLKRKGFSLEQLLHSRGDFNPLNLITTSSFCGVGSSFCTILPDGSIIPCPLFRSSKFIAGNINEGFKKVWEESEVLKKFRLSINEISKCKVCKWKMKCLGGCRAQAYQYFGDIKKPDPESCAIFKVFNELKT